MTKTAELKSFERLVNENMLSEIPKEAKNIRLRAVSNEFFELVEKLNIEHHGESYKNTVISKHK